MTQTDRPTIETYLNLDEKKSFLGITAFDKVDTNLKEFLEQLDKWEEIYKTGHTRNGIVPKLFFRGVNDAKFLLYNSVQVCYSLNFNKLHPPQKDSCNYSLLINKHYDTFITYLIEETLNSDQECVKNFLSRNNFPKDNVLPFLSFMQHYGIPTPLLDFSNNKYASLYFAQSGLPEDIATTPPSENEIDNYISLFMVAEVAHPLVFMRNFFDHDFAEYHKTFKISYEQLGRSRLLVFTHNDSTYQMTNTDRIKAQEGLFFFNSHISWPLEYHYYDIVNRQPSFQKAYDARMPFPIQEDERFFGWCFNINKKLIPEVRELLTKKGITDASMYPDKPLNKKAILDKVIERMKTRNEQKI